MAIYIMKPWYGKGSGVVNIYSAALDTVTFQDSTGTKAIQTDASGHGSATIVVPYGGANITFTSYVAKNPSNLSQAYSKTINVTPLTTDIYVMPDNACYWYGYKSDEYEVINTENGYTWGTYAYEFLAPTESTNKLILYAPQGSQASGIGYKHPVTGTTAKTIAQGILNYSSSVYGAIYLSNSKSVWIDDALVDRKIDSTDLGTFAVDISSYTSKVLVLDVYNTREIDVHAFWYE